MLPLTTLAVIPAVEGAICGFAAPVEVRSGVTPKSLFDGNFKIQIQNYEMIRAFHTRRAIF